MTSAKEILDRNEAWAKARVKDDPAYFKRLAKEQKPQVLWIGCSDSRVAANVVTGTAPGEMFVHRNIANLVVATDLNMLSVLDFAVSKLKVKHVVVCGHYGCGGVEAAAGQKDLGLVSHWLRNIEDTFWANRDALRAIKNKTARLDRLVELNVEAQVLNLAKTAIVQAAWRGKRELMLHGWVYGLETGRLKSLRTMKGPGDLDAVFRYAAS